MLRAAAGCPHRCGDYVVHGTEGERYSLDASNFCSRYETEPCESCDEELRAEGFKLYRPVGRVRAHRLTEQECASHFPAGAFIAAWGSPMLVEPSDYLATPHPGGGEIYRIEAAAFANTYGPDG